VVRLLLIIRRLAMNGMTLAAWLVCKPARGFYTISVSSSNASLKLPPLWKWPLLMLPRHRTNGNFPTDPMPQHNEHARSSSNSNTNTTEPFKLIHKRQRVSLHTTISHKLPNITSVRALEYNGQSVGKWHFLNVGYNLVSRGHFIITHAQHNTQAITHGSSSMSQAGA
jgi:hypothetical protein